MKIYKHQVHRILVTKDGFILSYYYICIRSILNKLLKKQCKSTKHPESVLRYCIYYNIIVMYLIILVNNKNKPVIMYYFRWVLMFC